MLSDHVRPGTRVDPGTVPPPLPEWINLDIDNEVKQPRGPVPDGLRHSREHIRFQRERHKRREREYRAQRGWDSPFWPAHKPRSRSCTCPRCQRGRTVQQFIDKEADIAHFEEALQWQADTRALTR